MIVGEVFRYFKVEKVMTLHVWRLFRIPVERFTVRSFGSTPKTRQPHIYGKKYTKDELIKYMMDNIVYDSSHYVVTSVPQGVKLLNNDRWKDTESTLVCDTPLQDLVPELRSIFRTEYFFVTKHPRRNASGVVIFSKSFKACKLLRRHFVLAMHELRRIYTYLVVVVGTPAKSLNKTFRVEQISQGENLSVEILEEHVRGSVKTAKTKYNHTVVDVAEDVSLVKVSVSYDLRDCVRYILTQRCFTPPLGDFWSTKKAVDFLFGAPIAGGQGTMDDCPYKLKSHILKKLQLNPNEQNLLPIHVHLYGIKLALGNDSEFFVSVPPPESFVWTCRKLKLHGIVEFVPDFVGDVTNHSIESQ